MAAARLGLDPYSEAESYEQDIILAAEILEYQLLTDFLNSVSPNHIARSIAWISSLRSILERHQATVAPNAEVVQELRAAARRDVTHAASHPWDVGYEQARFVRERISPDRNYGWQLIASFQPLPGRRQISACKLWAESPVAPSRLLSSANLGPRALSGSPWPGLCGTTFGMIHPCF